MRTIIIDDEQKGRQALRNYATRYAPSLLIIGEADSVESGIALIEKERPELVFLDVQMPDGTGFDLLGMVEFNKFKVIFCTSHDSFAVKAFRFSALDYILKPIDPDIFKAAVQKALVENPEEQQPKIATLNANKSQFNLLALNAAEGISIVKISEIIRCESSVNYTRFILDGSPDILVTKTLKEYDELLCNQNFIRIHKSHLVNLHYIKKYLKEGWVVMADNSKIEVSRRKKDTLLEILKQL